MTKPMIDFGTDKQHAQIKAIIKDLQRCAKQNEKDALDRSCSDCSSAYAVAGEQRRMIKILRTLLK